MQRQFFILAALCFFVVSLKAQKSPGYEIKVKIPAFKESPVILAHHFAKENSYYPDDTVKLDKKGYGVFKSSKPLTGGMYIAYLPDRRFFDFIIGDNQHFSVEADTSDLSNKIYFQGSDENNVFKEYKTFRNTKGESMAKLNGMRKNSVSKTLDDSISKAINNLELEVTTYTKNVIKAHPELFFSKLLKSFIEIEVPEPPRDQNGNILDSTFKYRYYHQHYFDNFDISDPRMLNTPFYESKITNYLDKVVVQVPDSINKELDMIMKRASRNENVTKYLLGMLYNHCAGQANEIVGMDAVFTYFAENYYLPKATWADENFKQKLRDQLKKLKPLLIGKSAPEIKLIEIPAEHFKGAASDTALKSNPYVGFPMQLSTVKAKFLVLIFWEATCGHCQKSMPLLCDSVYPRIKSLGAEVLAVHAISSVDGKRKWIDFVNEHKMYNWINAWSPYSLDYRNAYDLLAFPAIFVLDENKKIISKRIGVEQLEELLKHELEKKEEAVSKLEKGFD